MWEKMYSLMDNRAATRVWMTHLSHRASMSWSEGQQSQVSGPFDCGGKLPLVPGTHTGLPPGFHLEPIGDVSPDSAYVFVINDLYVFDAKGAHFAPVDEAAPGPTPSTSGFGTAATALCRHGLTSTSEYIRD